MAPCKTLFYLSFCIFFLFTISITPSLALHPQKQEHFRVFNVKASIEKTRQLFADDDKTLKINVNGAEPKGAPTSIANPSNVLSVPLHPRLSITKHHYKSYRSLSLSRLDRDSARVNSILTRVRLALSNPSSSGLQPPGPDEISPLLSTVLSAGSGEYFALIGVGQPDQLYYMTIDTGSDVTWLQCQPCSVCYNQTGPIFDPEGSSSYRPVQCSSQLCASLRHSSCGDKGCLYKVAYGDRSTSSGDFATETLTFGDSGRVDNVPIGCGHENTGLFNESAGILALGGGAVSFTTHIKASSFSYCLVDRDTTDVSTLDFNSDTPGDSVLASIIKNPKFDVLLYVDLSGIVVAGEKVDIPESAFRVDESGRGGVIIDSGTTVTRFKSEIYDPFRDTFLKYTQNLKRAGTYSFLDTCYDLSDSTEEMVPTVSFLFGDGGGEVLTLNVLNYLMPVGEGIYCFAFAPVNELGVNIIGNVQQQLTRVNYDLANSILAFSQNEC